MNAAIVRVARSEMKLPTGSNVACFGVCLPVLCLGFIIYYPKKAELSPWVAKNEARHTAIGYLVVSLWSPRLGRWCSQQKILAPASSTWLPRRPGQTVKIYNQSSTNTDRQTNRQADGRTKGRNDARERERESE